MTAIAHLPGRAVLAVSGADRLTYLQGLVSNDVMEVAPGRAVWAALLTPQGKWLADFFMLAAAADGERLLLDVEAGQAEFLRTRLTRFRLRARVEVAATALRVAAGWDGPAPEGAVPDPRLAAAGWRLVGEALPEPTATEAEYDRHRLLLGLPDGSRDMDAEKTALLEAGFDELHGVSWTKGCYMGQELTARTKYRGLLKRRLFPVAVDGEAAAGMPVVADGAEVGTMRSSRGGAGLALLRLDAVGKELQCGTALLRPRVPGWMALGAGAVPA